MTTKNFILTGALLTTFLLTGCNLIVEKTVNLKNKNLVDNPQVTELKSVDNCDIKRVDYYKPYSDDKYYDTIIIDQTLYIAKCAKTATTEETVTTTEVKSLGKFGTSKIATIKKP